MKKKVLLDHEISEIIEKAWCDKTTFDDIHLHFNMKENDVKKENQ